jgi:hypothetical protein
LKALYAASQPGHDVTQPVTKSLDALIMERGDRSLPDHKADLEVVAAIDHDQQIRSRDAPYNSNGICFDARQPEPQDIHGHSECP